MGEGEVQGARVTVDRRLDVLLISESSSRVLHPLCLRIDEFAGRIRDAMLQISKDVRQSDFQNPGHFNDRFQAFVCCPVVQPTEVLPGGVFIRAFKQRHREFSQRPRPRFAMSYGPMKEDEHCLREVIRILLAQARATDDEEDARYGKDNSGDELPEELCRRKTRLKKIRQAMRALQQRAREEAEEEGQSQEEAREATPKDKAQYNFSDSESCIMKGADGFVQAYSVQAVVESTTQLIVAQAVTQQANDKQQVAPMVQAIEQRAAQKPDELLADSGYCSEKNLAHLEKQGIDAYIATEKQKHGSKKACSRGPLPKGATRTNRMRRKVQRNTGAAI